MPWWINLCICIGISGVAGMIEQKKDGDSLPAMLIGFCISIFAVPCVEALIIAIVCAIKIHMGLL